MTKDDKAAVETLKHLNQDLDAIEWVLNSIDKDVLLHLNTVLAGMTGNVKRIDTTLEHCKDVLSQLTTAKEFDGDIKDEDVMQQSLETIALQQKHLARIHKLKDVVDRVVTYSTLMKELTNE